MQHDQKKVNETLSEQEVQQRAVEADKFKALLEQTMALRAQWRDAAAAEKIRSEAATLSDFIAKIKADLATIQPLLERNPDCYSVFALRRQLFEALKQAMWIELQEKQKQQSKEQQEPEQQQNAQQAEELFNLQFSKETLVAELKFNTAIVKRDYKSYAAWVHRRWVLNLMHPKVRLAVIREEYAKIDALLAQDERNFHAWGYRRWVTSELKAVGLYSDDDELAFATSKIGNNFSNYSAWHNRALVLWGRIDQLLSLSSSSSSLTPEQREKLVKDIDGQITADRTMLVQAFYCDPHDQSAFVYCKNLVQKVHGAATNSSNANETLIEANKALQKAVFDACVELAEEEKQCAWPRYMKLCLPLHPVATKEAAVAAWSELQQLDPMRKNYFQSEIEKLN